MGQCAIVLAICWDCWVLPWAVGCWWVGIRGNRLFYWGRSGHCPARGGSMAGPSGDALHCMPMHGLHLTADLHGMPLRRIGSPMPMPLGRACLMPWSPVARVRRWGRFFTPFLPRPTGPACVTATVLLAEFAPGVHTWPEQAAVTLDVWVQLWRRPQRQSPCPDECSAGAAGGHHRAAPRFVNGRLRPVPGKPCSMSSTLPQPLFTRCPPCCWPLAWGVHAPLTDTCPKPLLEVQGLLLLQWHLRALAQAGGPAVINTAWLGSRSASGFQAILACRAHPDKRHQLSISYCTRAWILAGRWKPQAALPARCRSWGRCSGWPQAMCLRPISCSMPRPQAFEASGHLAHLWLVPNPAHNPRGDFGLTATGLALNLLPTTPRRATPAAPSRCCAPSCWLPLVRYPAGQPGRHGCPLAPCCAAPHQGRVGASIYTGRWTDVGTPGAPGRTQPLNGHAAGARALPAA